MPRRNQGAKLRWREDRGAYYIVWTIDGRSRKHGTGTADRKEAEGLLAQWLQIRGKPTGPSDPAQVLVADVLTYYATNHGRKVIGKETLANAIANLAAGFDGKTVADAPAHVDFYIKHRDRAAGTVRRELGVLQTAINYGHKKRLLTGTVTIELPPVPPSKERWLTRDEAAKLIRASRKDAKAQLYMPLFILIGIYTGRRKEAILSLRWSEVDLRAGVINFEIEGRERTKKQRGKAPIPDRLLPHLIRARRRGSDLGPVLHISGKPIANIRKGFAAACRRAGIEGVTPHCLRHTAATWLMQSGVNITMASAYLSMSEATLRRVYWHHHPDYMREAAEAIGRHERPENRLRPHSAPKRNW
jgi:integrase